MSPSKKIKERQIDCPRCWKKMDQEVVEVFGPNITIDTCPSCQGMWLDKGELRKLLGDKKLSDYLTKHIGTKTESKLVCPRCGNLMDHEFAEDTVVDVCLTCRGVWLDAGEMDSLKEKSNAGYEGDPELKAEELMQEAHAKERRSRLKRFKGRR